MKRSVGALAIAAGFFAVLYVTFAIGQHLGRAAEIRSQTRLDAERTMDLLVSGHPELALKLGLLHEASLDHAQEVASRLGPPTSYRVQDVTATPLGLPVIVQLEVVRKGKSYREILIRHGVSSPLDHADDR